MTVDRKTKWTQELAESRAALLECLSGLTPEQWDTVVFSEGDTWTVTTVVSHLVENERGMSIHVHKIRKGRETIPEGFDLENWNKGVKERMGNLTPSELLEALETTRAKTLEVMHSLQDDEWTLTGRHPSRGVITVEQYYETMAAHERGHTEDIKRALAAAQT
jgi:uncharacterized protein (TIGR03083 family)